VNCGKRTFVNGGETGTKTNKTIRREQMRRGIF